MEKSTTILGSIREMKSQGNPIPKIGETDKRIQRITIYHSSNPGTETSMGTSMEVRNLNSN